jgi:hypothetical protein
MNEYQFICKCHQQWVANNPSSAFITLVTMAHEAKLLAYTEGWEIALHHIGTAYETADILFKAAPQSPQLATMLTSMTLLMSEAFEYLSCIDDAKSLLIRVQSQLTNLGKQFETLKYQHCITCLDQALSNIEHSDFSIPVHHSSSLH